MRIVLFLLFLAPRYQAFLPPRSRALAFIRPARMSSPHSSSEMEKMEKLKVADPSQPVQGYLNPDLTKMDESKMSRVVVYILVALLPTLLLIPFYLSRNFVPADI